jgi:hypothetical protein
VRALAVFSFAPLLVACRPAASPRIEGATALTTRDRAEIVAPGVVSTDSVEVKITFSPDGGRMLWGAIGRAGGKGGFEIFESIKEPSGWSAPRSASFCSEANDFDPFFAPDGSGVYFFSNRPGGLGKDDLWFVPIAGAAYGEARNLGPNVNSAGDEWAPVVSPDGARLLFASDGRGGAGKHDLFVATRAPSGEWAAPVNLGAGVNGANEDFDATFLHDGRTIVFSSGDLENDVRLYVAYERDGAFTGRSLLGLDVNAPGAWAFGPAIAKGEPGVLYFTSSREGGTGKMDIYRIPYSLRPSR